MSNTEDFRAHFEKLGVATVRMMHENHRFNHLVGLEAIKWLAEKEAEDRERSAASSAEQLAFARATKDAAEASNAFAEDANAVAREANVIARAASASAALSAAAAKTNNVIATLALIAAAMAIAISVIGIFVK